MKNYIQRLIKEEKLDELIDKMRDNFIKLGKESIRRYCNHVNVVIAGRRFHDEDTEELDVKVYDAGGDIIIRRTVYEYKCEPFGIAEPRSKFVQITDDEFKKVYLKSMQQIFPEYRQDYLNNINKQALQDLGEETTLIK